MRRSPICQGTEHCGPEVPSGPVEVARESPLLSGVTMDLISPRWENECLFVDLRGMSRDVN